MITAIVETNLTLPDICILFTIEIYMFNICESEYFKQESKMPFKCLCVRVLFIWIVYQITFPVYQIFSCHTWHSQLEF
jgi:hypothetical protein